MEIRLIIDRATNNSEMVNFEDMTVGENFCIRGWFRNGYGISVIRNPHTYGGASGLYEIAVLNSNGEIDYTTDITGDVIGWLTRDEVVRYAGLIASL